MTVLLRSFVLYYPNTCNDAIHRVIHPNTPTVSTLNFPAYQFETRPAGERVLILDELRKKWLQLTPEEWVRQHVVRYLIEEKGTPAGLIGIEKGFQFQKMQRRADIIVHNRSGQPVMMVECKAPTVKLDQDVFDQIARYNMVIRAQYLYVTNGLQHYCYKIDSKSNRYGFVKELPAFEDL